MSGAAGLSAARRRRAGGSSIPQNAGIGTQSPVPQKTKSSTPHPMQILQDHEMRLRKIEPLMESLGTPSDSISQAPGVDLTGVMARIVALETEKQKTHSESNTDSLSETFMKLQTFAMETNTLVLKLQTRIDELESQLAEKDKEENETDMVAVSDLSEELQITEEEEQ
jgi:Fe2+ transport system protein B